MRRIIRTLVATVPAAALLITGCATINVDFSEFERPLRSSELSAYDVFVGSWNWEAETVNAEGPNRLWTGTAKWEWMLDNRCLRGTISAKSADAEFEAAGVWTWHPKKRKYIWWMFNNWGYPQEGTARYDAGARSWRMDYTSVGLDGTTSHGRYVMKVLDADTLEWSNEEWTDAWHLVKKLELRGTYKRQGR